MSTHFKKANLTLVLLLIISLCLSGNVKAAPENSGLYRASFTKKSPSNNATGVTVSQPTLQWNSASNVFRYVYCYYSYDLTSNVCDINDKATWKSNGTSTSVQLPTLAPNKKYYWQVGAKLNDNSFIYADGALTSKWAFSTGSGPSVQAGMYDNTYSNWIYTGKWAASTYTGTETGPYNKTYRESGDIPDYATFNFTGSRVALYYIQEPDRGVMNIYMDNSTTPIALNQSGPLTWQKIWMSGALASGTHTIKLVYVSGNPVNIDAIQIFAQADTTAPAAINLSGNPGVSPGTVTLKWTAVGDDGNTAGGTATTYLVRYSTTEIVTDEDWNNATAVTNGVPTPKVQGQAESMTLTGLTPGQSYYFAVRAQDEQFNIGMLSNSPQVVAYKDTIAPAAIDDLSATNDVNEGTVELSWTAVGDDDNVAGGAATTYLVRYSTSEIVTETDWNNAVPVSDGVPTPKVRGQAETMTVATGFTSGQTYFFAVRALDEASNRGGVSNSPSTLVLIPTMIMYDDRNSKLTYAGTWQQYNSTSTGPYQNTYTYSATTGNSATFTFTGNRFKLYYLQYTNRGTMNIYIDDLNTPVATLNQNGSQVWQKTWTSDLLTDGPHTVKLVHASGTYVDVDAIKTFAPPDATAPAAITDLTATNDVNAGAAILDWTAVGDDNNTAGGAATTYLVRYSTSEIVTETDWNNAIPVSDGVPTPQVRGQAETMAVTGLASGQTYFFAVRALDEASNRGGVSNSPSVLVQIPSTTMYDDRDSNWVYTGNWLEYNTTGTGPYQGTYTYSATVGNSATFTFTGTKFTLYYLQYTNRGTMYIYIDDLNTPVATLNQNGALVWQNTWTSDLLTDGFHTVRLRHASGTYVDVDAIKIVQ